MHPMVCILASFLIPAVGAQSFTSIYSELPTCAQRCLEAARPNTNCSLTDYACLCADDALNAYLGACASENCTHQEVLITLNVTADACHSPVRDASQGFRDLIIVFAAFSALSIILRVIQRLYFDSKLYLDDWLIVFSYVSSIPGVVINVFGLLANGLGRDIWTLSPDEITNFLRFFYINQVIYFTEVFLIKISLLIFYQRIFTQPTIRRVLYGTIAFCSVFILVFDLVVIFQCTPVSAFWESWDQRDDGQCMNVDLLAWINAAVSIAVDIWMLAIPMSQLWGLQLPWKKKTGVAMMFGLGVFVTAVSILRLRFLVEFKATDNPTYDEYEVIYWSIVERDVSLVCACLPNVRLLLSRLLPKKTYAGDLRESDENAHASLRKNSFAAAGADPGDKIMYSRSFQVEYLENKEGDYSSTMELREWSPTSSRS